jgi:hypothetical protein
VIYRYANPEIFDDLERPNFERYDGKLLLWGAGKLGSAVAHVLLQKGRDFFAFVDSDENRCGEEFCGYPVISPDELLSRYADGGAVIVSTIFRRDIMPWLSEHGIIAFEAWPLLLEFDWSDYDYMNELYMARMVDYYFLVLIRDFKLKKKYFVDTLIVNITNKCSLRCEQCSVLIPFIENPCNFDKEETITDTFATINAIGHFRELSLFGGEPLLHPALAEFINIFSESNSFDVLSVITNGTIVPNNETVLAMRTDPRMLVRISDYGILSRKIKELVQLLSDNSIMFELIDYKYWYKRPDIGMFDAPEAELCHKFNCCMAGAFPCVSNGKIFLCKPAMTLCEMDVIPLHESNFLDLPSLAKLPNDTNAAIYEYIAKMDRDDYYIDACRYCSGKASTELQDLVPPAVQAKGRLKLDRIVLSSDEEQ